LKKILLTGIAAVACLASITSAWAQGALTPAERAVAAELAELAMRYLAPAERAGAVSALEATVGKDTFAKGLEIFGVSRETLVSEAPGTLAAQARTFADLNPNLSVGLYGDTSALGKAPDFSGLSALKANPERFSFEKLGTKPLAFPKTSTAKAAESLEAAGVHTAEKSRNKEIDEAREWLDRVETACHMGKSATALMSEASTVPLDVQEWATWAHEKLWLCPENEQEALMRDLEERMQQLEQPPSGILDADDHGDSDKPSPWELPSVSSKAGDVQPEGETSALSPDAQPLPQAPSDWPWSADTLYATAYGYVMLGDYKQAESALSNFLVLYPNDGRVWLARFWLDQVRNYQLAGDVRR
jgi:hypothetical protein